MNITLFGANGAVGRLFAELAMADGHRVTGYVRRPDLLQPGEILDIVVGGLADKALMEKTIAGADVVVSALGPRLDMSRLVKDSPIAEAHRNIIDAMRRLGKRRFITIGAPGMKAAEDKPQLWTVLPPLLARLIYPNPYRQTRRIELLVKESGLDWTVVRFIYPGAGPSARYGVSLGDTPIKPGVSRRNIAAFMYTLARTNTYIKQMPIVFNE